MAKPTGVNCKNPATCIKCNHQIAAGEWRAGIAGGGAVWCEACFTKATGLDKDGNKVAPPVAARPKPIAAPPPPRNASCIKCGTWFAKGAWRAPITANAPDCCRSCWQAATVLDADTGKPLVTIISDAALHAEVKRREEQARLDEMARKNEVADRIIQNIDALLLLVPEHSRTSCSDADFRQNALHARCTRCALLEAEADGFWRNDIELDISARYDSEHATFK
jgi:hypothetical protein